MVRNYTDEQKKDESSKNDSSVYVEVTTIKIAKRHSSRTFWLVLLIIKNGSHLNEPNAKV